MAELEKNLGTLNSTLDRLVEEVSGLRSELQELKKNKCECFTKTSS